MGRELINHFNWDKTSSATKNFNKNFKCGQFDLIIASCTSPKHLPRASALCGKKTLVLNEIGDCHYGKCLSTFATDVHITTFRYGFIPLELFDSRNPINGKARQIVHKNMILAHNPDCANSDIFTPIPWENKSNNAILVGKPRLDLYPLRTKIRDGILSKQIPGKIIQHPGYMVSNNSIALPPSYYINSYNRSSPELREISNFQKDYAKTLSSSRICMFDSSVVRKNIRKFMEALMAGCVPASDLPFEMEEILRDVVIKLDAKMTTKEIGIVIEKELNDDKGLQIKAAEGNTLAARPRATVRSN